MLMRLLWRGVVFLIVLGLLQSALPSGSLAASDELPFLYYYADGEFVVERSDGSERRVLAAFEKPPDEIGPVGPGWSASGQWFTWYTQSGGRSPIGRVRRVQVVSRDGQEIITLLEDAGHVDNLRWSDGKDMLMVDFEHLSGDEDAYIGDEYTYIFDMTQGGRMIYVSPNRLEWAFEGNWAEHTDNQVRLRNEIGTAIDRLELGNLFNVFWSENGVVIYESTMGFPTIRNLADGTEVSFSDRSATPSFVDWNTDQTHALIYASGEVWLFTLEDFTTELITDNVLVDAVLYYTSTTWSPSGNYAWIPMQPTGLMVFDSATQQVQQVSTSNRPFPFPSFALWNNQDNLIFTGDDMVSVDDFPGVIRSYDPSSGEYTILVETEQIFNITASPNGGVAGYFGLCDNDNTFGFCLVNAVGESFSFPALREHQLQQTGGEVSWNLTGEQALVAQQDFGSTASIRVLDVPSLSQRDLTSCRFVDSCYGWLPPLEG